MQKFLAATLSVLLGALLIASTANAQDVKLFPDKTKPIGIYQNSYALIIGNGDYDFQTDLPKVSADADIVSAALAQQGFQIDQIDHNLSGKALRERVQAFVDKYGYQEDARVVIWFAGHGVTINGEGYLLGKDAPVINLDVKTTLNATLRDFYGAAMPIRSFGTILREMRSHHVMLVLDSCFAATIFADTRSGATRARSIEMENPTREIITSGGVGQKVADDGKFAQLFAEAITGKARYEGKTADSNGDGYLSGTELGYFLSQAAETPVQKPQFGKLPSANAKSNDVAAGIDVGGYNFEQGELFFVMPGGVPTPKEDPDNDPNIVDEQIEWRDLAEGTQIAVGADPAPVYIHEPPSVGEKKYSLRSRENFPAVGAKVRFQVAKIGDKQWVRFEQDHIKHYVLDGDVAIVRPN
ncbi:caspase family protein [Mesorhizobium sp. L103C120A0]|uniref:caspase family protein n=1 Tax=Mesorhizobium sp. L103C120A0 TaxID=1287086 RepID=UPI00041616AD|nr:caspase family protein [Mesorhizobium sp. L103C120A0]